MPDAMTESPTLPALMMAHRPPPALLIAAALLFWGAMTGRLWMGAAAAVLAGAARVICWRWDFDEADVSRAWRVSITALLGAAVLIWLDGARHRALPLLLSWMPLLMMPVQFVQSYGLRGPLPLDAFSLVAGRERERRQRFGRTGETRWLDVGNLMIPCCLVAASVGPRADSVAFLAGVVLLAGWHLASQDAARSRWLVPMMILIGIAGWQGDGVVRDVGEWLGRQTGETTRGFDPNLNPTLIGVTGKLAPNPELLWRIRPEPGSAIPRLLRTGTFNTFSGRQWQNQRHAVSDFKDLDTRVIDGDPYWIVESRHDWEQRASGAVGEPQRIPSPATMPAFRLRGTVAAETPLPLPGDVAAVGGFELDGIERNSFGTVRVFPKDPVIDGLVVWKGDTNPESPPIPGEDLRMPLAERKTARAILKEIGLDARDPLHRQLDVMRRWFLGSFKYSQDLAIRHRPHGAAGGTAITRFLTRDRAGHCEYFATAATLLLRELGVPARYATGFAVAEHDPRRGGFVIRRSHGHAWCRVWNAADGRWLDFDPTPPDWLAGATPKTTFAQRFNDSLKRMREDFFLWRHRPEHRVPVVVAITLLGLAFTGWIARRLWQSRRRMPDEPGRHAPQQPVVRTPLHDLERLATPHLGIRPAGLPYARWLGGLSAVLPGTAVVDDACALHQRIRFDPAGGAPDSLERLGSLAAEIARRLDGIDPGSADPPA
jgi:transglutaminase-like putative cysteine protease